MQKRSDAPSRAARRRFLKTVPAAVAAGIAGLPSLSRRRSRADRQGDARMRREDFGVDFPSRTASGAHGVNTNLANFERLRTFEIPPETEPALTFRPYLPGKKPKPGATPGAKIKIATAAPRTAPRVRRGPGIPARDGAVATGAAA